MALTPAEIQFKRLNDPYFGLAESVSAPSLAMQKGISNASKEVEKKRRIDPAAQLSEEQLQADLEAASGQGSSAGLLDIAESSFFKSRENIFDLISGNKGTPGVDRNQENQEFADLLAGVTPEDRQRLVTDNQDKVIESLAQGGLQGHLDALGHAIKAGPGTLADSASILGEIGVGALLTATGVGAAGSVGLAANRGRKVIEGGSKIFKALDKAKGALSSAAKAASQVSIAAVDITQGNVNDFRAKQGRDPTRGEGALMLGLNLATMMPTPSIIKNLFVPSFKKEIKKEIGSVVKNVKGKSNFKSIMSRVWDASKKITVAGGAEAAQEYFQTWAEEINVNLAPATRKDFWGGVLDVVKNEDSQFAAKVGSFLGFGAGGVARAGIAAPGVAVGTAVDTAVGTAKTGVKAAVGLTKAAGKVAKHVTDKRAFQVLSEEEINEIKGDRDSRKVIVDAKVADFQATVDTIEAADIIEDLRLDEEISKKVSELIQENEFTDADLRKPKVIKQLKRELVKPVKSKIALLKIELEADTGVAVVKQASKNVQRKTVEAAKAAVEAVSPGVKAVIQTVTDLELGKKAVKAVDEIRSSTALGMIELATHASKKEVKQILEAAKTLDKHDLDRVTAVIGEMKPEIGRQLLKVQKAKDKALERTGLKRDELINEATLNPIIKDVADRGSIDAGEVASVSKALNETVAGNIDDMSSLKKTEAALAAVEASEDFKNQTNGAMSRDGAVAVKRKLKKVRDKLLGRPKEVKDKVTGAVDSVVKSVKGTLDSGSKLTPEITDKMEALKALRKIVKDLKNKAQDELDTGTRTAADAFLAEHKRLKAKADKLDKEIDADLDIPEGESRGSDVALRAASAVSSAVSEAVEEFNKVEINSTFQAVIDGVLETLKDPKLDDALADSADIFLKQMKQFGVRTRGEFESFVEQFPDLKNNSTFFKRLDQAYPTTLSADQLFDNVVTKGLETITKFKEAYNSMVPGCRV